MTKQASYEGRVVLVTGGTSGIGLAIARSFYARDAQVVVCGRDQARLAAAGRSMPRARCVVCDVTDATQVEQMVASIARDLGRIDILVSNAGVLFERDFTAPVDMSGIEREVAVNLTAPMTIVQTAFPLLQKSADAAVVIVTSGYALAPAARAPVYSAAKAGLRSFAKSLRRQLRGSGIAVLEVLPPLVDTPAVAHRAGKKIAPSEVARQVLAGLENRRSEVFVGDTRILRVLMRLAPAFAESLMARN